MASNLLKSIALSLYSAQPAEIRRGLEGYQSAPMRWEEASVGGYRWINDAYNANPPLCAPHSRPFLRSSTPSLAVIGCMHELGDRAEEEHEALAAYLDTLSLDGWVVLGSWAQRMESIGSGVALTSHADAWDYLAERVQLGDAILLKGSRGEAIEKVLELCKEERV